MLHTHEQEKYSRTRTRSPPNDFIHILFHHHYHQHHLRHHHHQVLV